MSSFQFLANSIVVNATSASSTRAALVMPASLSVWSNAINVANATNGDIWVNFGDATVVAAFPTAGSPQPGYLVQGNETFPAPVAGASHVAVIASAGTTNPVYVTCGTNRA